jgi:predicted nucleic acid-binding protein
MILVDSSVWIDYLNGNDTEQANFLDRAIGKQGIVIGDLIFMEVLQGFKKEKDFMEVKNFLEEFPFFVLVGKEMALQSALNYRTLRTNGFTVRKTIDVLIGTFCIENGVTLLHSDRDFDPMIEFFGLKSVF